jgi:hypothetical protein
VEQWGLIPAADFPAPEDDVLEAVMKTILLTAAALTLGTSAHAWAPMQDEGRKDGAASWQGGAKPGSDGTVWADADLKSKAMVGGVMAASADAGFAKPASAGWSGGKDMSASDGMTWADADLKSKAMVGGVTMASAGSWSGRKTANDGGLTWADADLKSKAMVGGIAMASAGMSMGQGGPLEPASYPACRPGRGDDNCIQLYERGVRAAAIAMGGPYEPAAGAAKAQAPAASASGAKVPDEGDEAEMAGASGAPKGAADPHAGHDMNGAKPAASTPTPNLGVGGPIEARSGYPACSATVTDSCIQRHERGVTGAGN